MRNFQVQSIPCHSLVADDGFLYLSPRSATIRVSIHLCCTVLLGAFMLWGFLAEPPVLGFFCSDTSIRYPLRAETVPSSLATILVVGIPSILFVVVELLYAFVADKSGLSLVPLQCCSLPKFLLDAYTTFGGFVFGLILSFSVANVAKLSIGRLRPHFLAVCQPNWEALTCSDSTGPILVEKYDCLGTDSEAIREARLSFFSAHSSNSSFAMVYTLIYLQCRIGGPPGAAGSRPFRRMLHANKGAEWLWDVATALRPFIQGALLLLCFFIAFSRIYDSYHHLGDVATGLLVGTIVAFYAAFWVSRLHRFT
ncbi:lipid phosphate phosphohydrolase [Cyclospora cayetanensis]|uniref:Lipid phosphate phosphohydrolase n=1 Tax=Cyclospora cayetanensis TaxID=88456 RepID=A0A1D3CVZ1_9EIME|nr:lipid phosphate phosphohydrolase [Cyclospora cayetanensis]